MIIRCIDLETTGLDGAKDAPCEIGWTDLEQATEGVWAPCQTRERLCNPGQPIPAIASAIHHITDADVRGRMLWRPALAEAFGADETPADCVAFAAHNTRFERLWISDAIAGPTRRWLCTYRCALRLWPDAPSHSAQALRYWRGLTVSYDGLPHRAGQDSHITALLAAEMLGLATGRELMAWSSEPALLPRVGFGKHAGKLWSEVDMGYLRWTEGQDFDEDVRFTVACEIERREAETPRPARSGRR